MSDKPIENGFFCEQHDIRYIKNCPTCLYEARQASYPKICPLTGWKQYGEIQLPDSNEYAMTYASDGPVYNSYTIPRLDSEGLVFEQYNFDHDYGNWKDDAPECVADLQDVLIDLLKLSSEQLPESHKWLQNRINYVVSEVERVEKEME